MVCSRAQGLHTGKSGAYRKQHLARVFGDSGFARLDGAVVDPAARH